MAVQVYIAVVDRNKLSIVFGNSQLYIEIYGGENIANFRVVGMGEKNGIVKLNVDESYNERNEGAKCVSFIVKQKGDEE